MTNARKKLIDKQRQLTTQKTNDYSKGIGDWMHITLFS